MISFAHLQRDNYTTGTCSKCAYIWKLALDVKLFYVLSKIVNNLIVRNENVKNGCRCSGGWQTPSVIYGTDVTELLINKLRPKQNGCHFADDKFKCIFLNEIVWISITLSLKFDPKGPTNIIPALVQIMAWHPPGNKPLSGPMMARLPTHICVTRLQIVIWNATKIWNSSIIILIFMTSTCHQNYKNRLYPTKKRKYARLNSHYCACRWRSTLGCKDICWYGGDQFHGSYMVRRLND